MLSCCKSHIVIKKKEPKCFKNVVKNSIITRSNRITTINPNIVALKQN